MRVYLCYAVGPVDASIAARLRAVAAAYDIAIQHLGDFQENCYCKPDKFVWLLIACIHGSSRGLSDSVSSRLLFYETLHLITIIQFPSPRIRQQKTSKKGKNRNRHSANQKPHCAFGLKRISTLNPFFPFCWRVFSEHSFQQPQITPPRQKKRFSSIECARSGSTADAIQISFLLLCLNSHGSLPCPLPYKQLCSTGGRFYIYRGATELSIFLASSSYCRKLMAFNSTFSRL